MMREPGTHERESRLLPAAGEPGRASRRGSPSALARLLGLQRGAGNAAVSLLLRQPVPPTAQRRPAPLSPAQEAVEYLRNLASFAAALGDQARLVVANTRATAAERQRTHGVIDQARLARMLGQARSVYEAQVNALPGGDALRTDLRASYVAALGAIRRAADDALQLSDGLSPAVRDAEQVAYAGNLAAWIEASPMTSAGLSSTTAFRQADAAQGTAYERELDGFLDDLLTRLPGLALGPAQREQLSGQLQAALRRALVTIAPGPNTTLDVSAISDPALVDKYRRVAALLRTAMPNAQPLELITNWMAPYHLADPVPQVTAQQLAGTPLGALDTSHVPPDELDSVRFAILQAGLNVFPAASGISHRNAVWPLSIPVRRGGTGPLTRVRYELVFDAQGGVRAERLGPAVAREVTPAFAALSIPDKKAQLVADLGLSGVDDRPAHGARPAASWTGPELDDVKAALDRLSPADRAGLHGFALIRDHAGPPMPGGRVLTGFTHTGADAAHDTPGPAAHGPPHIHYYDAAFREAAAQPDEPATAVGAPGDSGPDADWTILHEVGHAEMDRALLDANAQITAANAQGAAGLLAFNQASAAVQWGAHPQWLQRRNQFVIAQNAANAANSSFNAAAVSSNAAVVAQRPQRLAAAQAAKATRDARLADLGAAGVPQAVVAGAQAMAAAADSSLAASQAVIAAGQQIPTFVALAGRFGFQAFTAYGRTANEEWFAETYALYRNDPNRLNEMNRSMFLWFEAGRQMDPAWSP
jgi:hypothetical protein